MQNINLSDCCLCSVNDNTSPMLCVEGCSELALCLQLLCAAWGAIGVECRIDKSLLEEGVSETNTRGLGKRAAWGPIKAMESRTEGLPEVESRNL